jgi:2-C-methyl-D-erythritol 2,4-cyclodiphosphate synthase
MFVAHQAGTLGPVHPLVLQRKCNLPFQQALRTRPHSRCVQHASCTCDMDSVSKHARSSKISSPRRLQGPKARPCEAAAALTLEPKEQAPASKAPPALPYRVGHGFDLHRLEEGPYKLILGGLEIPHDRGCVAHSDGECTCLFMRLQ